jgi:hypothetical protein
MLENHVAICPARWGGHPNDPAAPDETRPDGCECRNVDEEGHDDPAGEHDPEDEKCPLNRVGEEDECDGDD